MELRINACKYKQDAVRTPALALQQVNSVDDPWGRRTTALCISTGPSGDRLISKETCRHNGRRFKLEEEVSKHLYTKGAITGVVQLKDCDHVRGEPLEIGLGDDIRRKMRLALLADGEYLREAKSVNDLLKTFYDVLEGHRTVYLKRQDLHCDMSMFNALMCPWWAKVEGRPVFKNKPPLIQEVLGESFRNFEDCTAQCLVLDVDNSAILRVGAMDEDQDLAYRSGKPIYMARSVCVGKPQNNALSLEGVRMPTLTEEAERLYVKAYGQPRYDRFTDKIPYTFHGGNPPDERPDPVPSFVHRACHDAESIFWTMLDALLLAQPEFADPEPHASMLVAELWKDLREHFIPDQPSRYRDTRDAIFMMGDTQWEEHFHSVMRDVAYLLFRISQLIAPEYEYWTPRPPDDHLHEAVQRLILQYLVDHRDMDISLLPGRSRPTQPKQNRNYESTPIATGGKLGPGTYDGRRGTGLRSSAQRPSKSQPANASRDSGSRTPFVAGSRRPGFEVTGSRTSATSKPQEPVVVDPKRKSESHCGRGSKRPKVFTGSRLPIDEVDEA